MRLVLDTNVLVAAMRSPRGASARLIVAGLESRIELVASVGLFAEYEAVMTRAEHLAAARTTRARVLAVLDDLAGVIRPAERDFSWRPQLADSNDEMVLEAAINGGADWIVTFEVKTFLEATKRFGIETVTPKTAWSKIQR